MWMPVDAESVGYGESVRDLERQYVPTFFPRPNHSPSGVPGLTGLVPQSVSSPSRNTPSTRSASRLRSSSPERPCSPGVSLRSCCTASGESLLSQVSLDPLCTLALERSWEGCADSNPLRAVAGWAP